MIDSILAAYIELVAKLLRRLRFNVGITGISISLNEQAEESIDQRIAQLDSARSNLAKGISAIDELKGEAEKNKAAAAEMAETISGLQADRDRLANELEAIRSVMDTDVKAFREVAGVPTSRDVKRERVVGFVSGVLASAVASGVVIGLSALFSQLLS
jgi:ABC-type transporter Mla subunit MlaD